HSLQWICAYSGSEERRLLRVRSTLQSVQRGCAGRGTDAVPMRQCGESTPCSCRRYPGYWYDMQHHPACPDQSDHAADDQLVSVAKREYSGLQLLHSPAEEAG